jgi:hypothetical protein
LKNFGLEIFFRKRYTGLRASLTLKGRPSPADRA